MNIIERLAHQSNRKTLKTACYIALALVFAADFFIQRHHAVFIWDNIPGFSAVYGFISCVLIIVVSKFVGHAWLMKKEDYYD
ncbi:MAG: hypothetical protein HZB21_01675 [Deltaproteobacteria bacterium]|nr:hypothetical protein [Deltaproteobacteria bacterium]MBI5809890.1 hypothetical protein [Deltaproteobacteria bacterium]